MTDLISRQAAIEAVKKAWMDGAYYTSTINSIKDLPPIDPVKHGKWTATERNFGSRYTIFGYECSVCDGLNAGESNFCPNCGAKMEIE